MSLEETVSAWIESLPQACGEVSEPNLAKRRKLFQHQRQRFERSRRQQPSPPTSYNEGDRLNTQGQAMELDMTPTPKRARRLASDVVTDHDIANATPRAASAFPRSLAQSRAATTSSPSKSVSSASHHSRSSSPIKRQIMELRLHHTINVVQLSMDEPPNDTAGALLERLQLISNSFEILPHSEKDIILHSPELKSFATKPVWRMAFQSGEQQKDLEQASPLSGRIPTPAEVHFVREQAKDCYDMDHEEAAWNAQVHWRLLEFVFRKPYSGKPTSGSVNVTYCTTARPHPRWLACGINAKMVDFCLYAVASDDPALLTAVENLCHALGALSTNHTDFAPLQFNPILLSIETKKPDTEAGKAQLQMAVWHSAQWGFLKEAARAGALSRLSCRTERSEDDDDGQREEPGIEHEVEQAFQRLPFLPGIIVSGHRWSFVLSTWEGSIKENRSEIKFWREFQFGSSESLLEIYQVVAGLREIARWTTQVYLPWFRTYVLNM